MTPFPPRNIIQNCNSMSHTRSEYGQTQASFLIARHGPLTLLPCCSQSVTPNSD